MKSKPSKSARKREYLALQNLGEQLIGLTPGQLNSIGLDESLLDAVLAARTMRAHGGLRRQKQLIGKLMRNTDAEPISAALDAFGRNDRFDKEIFRQTEEWRERLTNGGEKEYRRFTEHIGNENENLREALQSWFSAPDDDVRRLARRRVFRELHKDLTSKMQNRAASI